MHVVRRDVMSELSDVHSGTYVHTCGVLSIFVPHVLFFCVFTDVVMEGEFSIWPQQSTIKVNTYLLLMVTNGYY